MELMWVGHRSLPLKVFGQLLVWFPLFPRFRGIEIIDVLMPSSKGRYCRCQLMMLSVSLAEVRPPVMGFSAPRLMNLHVATEAMSLARDMVKNGGAFE
jgi:hypothetical protein